MWAKYGYAVLEARQRTLQSNKYKQAHNLYSLYVHIEKCPYYSFAGSIPDLVPQELRIAETHFQEQKSDHAVKLD